MRSELSPSMIWFRSLFALAAIAAFAVAACGCAGGLAATYATLTGTERIVERAASRFPEYSEQKQQVLLDAAKTRAEYDQAAAAWRKKREPAVKAIEGAQALLQLARDGIADVRAGLKNPAELGGWVTAAIDAARNLAPVLAALGFDPGAP
jgi:hypothetical protein